MRIFRTETYRQNFFIHIGNLRRRHLFRKFVTADVIKADIQLVGLVPLPDVDTCALLGNASDVCQCHFYGICFDRFIQDMPQIISICT